MTLHNWIIGGLAVTALAVAVFAGGTTTVVENFGAAAGPERTNECESRNGVEQCFKRSSLNISTTTVCAIRAPIHSTSTLDSASIKLTSNGAAAATVITIAKASTAFATTTSLGKGNLAAGAQGTIIATTTPLDATDEDKTFAPGQYVVFGMQGGQPGTFSPVGSCQATFEVM